MCRINQRFPVVSHGLTGCLVKQSSRVIRCLWVISCFWMISCVVLRADDNSATERPNLLLILSDDHSYPFLSCYGDTNVKTPNLDRLAAEGIRFHRYFTSCPQCVPSRAALMTGKSPVAARMTRFSSPLPKSERTLPEILRDDANYFTGICGRSFHLDGSVGKNPVADEVLQKYGMKTFSQRVDYLQNCGDNQVAEKVAEFLESRPRNRPFFLWANFSDPHHVWNAPAEFRPDPGTLQLPAHWPDLPGVREQVADYCAEVNRLDQSVGALLGELEKRDLLNRTVVVFTGDNGAALPHGKGSLYDPGSNVPLIVRWPGVKTKGSESKTLLSGEDITPTFLSAAGLKGDSSMSGRSFWNLVVGDDYTPRQFVFVERGPHGSAPVSASMSNSGYDLSRSVRSDRFKFIYNCTPWIPYSPVDSAGGAGWSQIKTAHASNQLSEGLQKTYFSSPRPVYELYDLETDPSELSNLAGSGELADVEDSLRAALIEKMILDFDYLPLPEPYSTASRSRQKPTNSTATEAEKQRSIQFEKLDRDKNGRLSKEEFQSNRQPADAERWFLQRDTNKDGFVDRAEFLPRSPSNR